MRTDADCQTEMFVQAVATLVVVLLLVVTLMCRDFVLKRRIPGVFVA
jgi:hypothetical protein